MPYSQYARSLLSFISIMLLAAWSVSANSQQKLPGFAASPWFGEQTREETTSEGIRILLNAPEPAKFDRKRPTLLIVYATPNGNTIEQTMGSAMEKGTDWHFYIQHIAAQTRLLREVDKEENIVLACVQAEERSWPAWRQKHGDNAIVIHALVESLLKRVPGAPVRVALSGHSGGGSFLFGFLNSVEAIPAYVERIAFLDANYSFSPSVKHGDKLLAWLNGNRKRHLVVLAYDDRYITVDNKPVNGPEGGTYRATHQMLESFAGHVALAETVQGDFTKWEGLQGRCLFLLHNNPDNKILHTALVGDMNGFLMAVTYGTTNATTWGTFPGPRAYTNWIQPAAPLPHPGRPPAGKDTLSLPRNALGEGSGLFLIEQRTQSDKPFPNVPSSSKDAGLGNIPPRSASAPGGAEVMEHVASLPLANREEVLWQQIASGNLPDFLRHFRPIRVTGMDSKGIMHTLEYAVMPDYLAVGSDTDFVRVPLTPITAERIAARFDCTLPTRKMINDIYAQSDLKLEPRPLTLEREAVKTFVEHNAIIETQRQGKPLGLLVSGIKKDVVTTPLLRLHPSHVAIYGWHKPDGNPIQPLTTIHRDTYVDYSHGLRLVKQNLLADGKPATLKTVLSDPHLRFLLSDEEPFISENTPMPSADAAPTPTAYLRFADEVETNLKQHVLAQWFPASLDRKHGGFYQNFREDWTRDPKNDKGLVYQSRLTWIAAQSALRFPEHANTAYAMHGVDFLDTKLWDREHGGFFWSLDENGQPERNGEKHVYGIAFAIYAAAACYQVTKEPRTLDLAKRAYVWLETHAHDKINGGYYEALTREGKPILAPPAAPNSGTNDFIGTRYGYKSMNTHIHLLEALTALYRVWPDAKIRTRLQEVFTLVRDRIVVEPGCMNLFYTPSWRPIPDHDSFGHDVETAYLLVEAAQALHIPQDAKTWKCARQLVDHALEFGWDETNGGFYDSGTAFGPPIVTDKIWWVEAEGLNALLLMHEKYGTETPRYWQAFQRQWKFIATQQTDNRYGGWHATVTRDGKPIPGHIKSDQWTEAYHQGRALLVVSATLRHLAEPEKLKQ